MIDEFSGRVAVITGAASGFGLEAARQAAALGMRLVLVDIDRAALDGVATALRDGGSEVLDVALDVARAGEMDALGAAVFERFGAPHLVFNNAGVGAGGLIWEHSAHDWDWVIGVNLMGVAHGVRVFVPRMLAAARHDPAYRGHIVNTASMAGLLSPPNMGAYNVSKHAVVGLSETLYHDLRLVTEQIGASVLCPYFVPTAILDSHRHRPAELPAQQATGSQRLAHAMLGKAIEAGRVGAAEVVSAVFAAVRADRFYVYSHPGALGAVRTRLEDIVGGRNPSDPFADRPDLGRQLKQALRDMNQ